MEPVDNQNPSFLFNDPGEFELKQVAFTEEGCRDSSSFTIISAIPEYDLGLLDFEVVEQPDANLLVLEILNNSNLPVTNFSINVELENDFVLSERFDGVIDRGGQVVHQLDLEIPSQQDLNYICIELQSPSDEYQDLNPDNNAICLDLINTISIEQPYPNPTDGISNLKLVLPRSMDLKTQIV